MKDKDPDARIAPSRFFVSLIPGPKVFAAFVIGTLVVVAGTQLPEEFWLELLNSRYFEPDVIGFISLGAVYLLAILLMAPLSPFALTAGVLFGFWWGTFLALLALNTGAALAFFIARYLLRQRIARKVSANDRMAMLARAMSGNAVKTIAVLRLNPIVPFNLQNYVCGATGVGFARYAMGTFLGAAPCTVALVFLGGSGRQFVVATGLDLEQWTWLLFAVGLLLTAPMSWVMVRNLVKRLRECRGNDKAAEGE